MAKLGGKVHRDSNEVVACIQEGLGNQLFQYAMGRAFSDRLGFPLKLDLRYFTANAGRAFQLDLFNTRYEKFDGIDRLKLAFNNSPKLRRIRPVAERILPHLLYRIVKDTQQGFDPGLEALRDQRIYLTGYWQTERYFESIAQIIRDELSFRQPPSAPNQAMLEQIDSIEAVSLHVRRGDYKDVPLLGGLIGDSGLQYYQHAVDHIRQRTHSPHFFIFSDDPDWARDHLAFITPRTLVTHNTGANSYEDMRLMSRCRHCIIANSSFSWWGAWLAKNPSKMVIAPKLWFTDGRGAGRDIVPTAWVRL